MNMSKLVLLALVVPSVFARAEVARPGPLEAKLQHELLAPCCYRETLYRHMSDTAIAMKAEMHEMIASGKSERDVIELYKSRYGARILAEPEGAVWWTATLVPLFALAIGAAAVVRIIRKWSAESVLSQEH
jgi:cytochrome c-type biogenesis protein CcmH/NrfF